MKYIIYTGVLFMPDRNAAAQRARAISSLIERCGYIPIVIGMDERISLKTNILETKKEYGSGYYYLRKYPNSLKEWSNILHDISHIIRVVRELGEENVKAIIVMDYFSLALLKLMKFCKKNSIMLVADTVDWFQHSKDPFPRNVIKNIDTKLRMRYVNKKVERIIAISKYLYEYYSPNAKHISMIPGIVLPQDLDPSSGNSDKYIIDHSYRNIGFVGSPGPKCNKEKIDWLIKIACKKTLEGKRIRVYLAGVDKKSLFMNRKDLSEIPNFDNVIFCLGRLSHNECLQLINECDFAAIIREDNLLSRAGFPTKLGEAFSCHTPVLVTPTSNISDYIDKAHGIIATECTEEATEAAVNSLLELSDSEIQIMHDAVREHNPLEEKWFADEMKSILE